MGSEAIKILKEEEIAIHGWLYVGIVEGRAEYQDWWWSAYLNVCLSNIFYEYFHHIIWQTSKSINAGLTPDINYEKAVWFQFKSMLLIFFSNIISDYSESQKNS